MYTDQFGSVIGAYVLGRTPYESINIRNGQQPLIGQFVASVAINIATLWPLSLRGHCNVPLQTMLFIPIHVINGTG